MKAHTAPPHTNGTAILMALKLQLTGLHEPDHRVLVDVCALAEARLRCLIPRRARALAKEVSAGSSRRRQQWQEL